MSERAARRLVRVSGSALLVLFVVLRLVGPHAPAERNPPGFRDPVVAFELASTPEDVLGILGRPGTAIRAETVPRMVHATQVDFAFLVVYPAFYVGVAALLAAERRVARGIVPVIAACAVAMAVADALENRQLLLLAAAADPGAMSIPLAWLRLFTLVKWYVLFVASAILAVAGWRAGGWWRWSAPFLALAAVLGAETARWPPAVEWAIAPLGVAWMICYVAALARPRRAT